MQPIQPDYDARLNKAGALMLGAAILISLYLNSQTPPAMDPITTPIVRFIHDATGTSCVVAFVAMGVLALSGRKSPSVLMSVSIPFALLWLVRMGDLIDLPWSAPNVSLLFSACAGLGVFLAWVAQVSVHSFSLGKVAWPRANAPEADPTPTMKPAS